jgi:hypothetical protein
LSRALPARYVPPSGFGYPRDGLRPPSPCRFCFAPAALMGFTLRSFTSRQVSEAFPRRMHPLTVSPVVVPNAEATGRPDRPRFLGVNPVGRSCRPGMGLACRPQDAPLGFALLRFSREDLDQDFARSPLACFSESATNRRSAAPESLDRPSPGSVLSPQRTAIMDRTTFLGFSHRSDPRHSSERSSGLCVHL